MSISYFNFANQQIHTWDLPEKQWYPQANSERLGQLGSLELWPQQWGNTPRTVSNLLASSWFPFHSACSTLNNCIHTHDFSLSVYANSPKYITAQIPSFLYSTLPQADRLSSLNQGNPGQYLFHALVYGTWELSLILPSFPLSLTDVDSDSQGSLHSISSSESHWCCPISVQIWW